jgi:hypothetical protein
MAFALFSDWYGALEKRPGALHPTEARNTGVPFLRVIFNEVQVSGTSLRIVQSE